MSDDAMEYQRLERILEFSHELTSTTSLEPLLHKIVKAATELTNSEMSGLLLFDEAGDDLRFLVASSFLDQLVNVPIPIAGSIAGAAFSSGKPVIVPNVQEDPRYYRKVEELIGVQAHSLLAVPLQFRERRIGVLEIENKHGGGTFDEEDIETLTALAAHATIAIENARMVTALEESRTALEQRVKERTTDLTMANASLKNEVAERIRIEEQLRDYTVALEARNEELAAFCHTVAHDLRNPLNRVIGYADILRSGYSDLSDENLKDFLHIIVQGGHKIDRIIDELLLLAGVREQSVELVPLDMKRIVAETQERLAEVINETQAELAFPEQWPTVLGYGPWIEEVWMNYISNALKYGGSPPYIELGVSIRNDNAATFWVKDNGIGIDADHQTDLFVPFERLEQVRTEGHGLGLSIVRRIIEKLGGEVGVESDGVPGQGSRFFFILPLA